MNYEAPTDPVTASMLRLRMRLYQSREPLI